MTNQIVTCTSLSNNKDNELNEINDNSVIPSLGSSWTHFVNIRFILQFLNDDIREVFY